MFFPDDEKTGTDWPPAPTMEHITESFAHKDSRDADNHPQKPTPKDSDD